MLKYKQDSRSSFSEMKALEKLTIFILFKIKNFHMISQAQGQCGYSSRRPILALRFTRFTPFPLFLCC